MLTTYIFVTIAASFCTSFDTSGILNLIRRPSIPLHQMHLETYLQKFRRFNREDYVNYRKTKDVYNTLDANPEAVETFDTMTQGIEEPNDNIAKIMDKTNGNYLNDRNDYIVGRRIERNKGQEQDDRKDRSEINERREWDEKHSHAEDKVDKYDGLKRNSHQERPDNVYGEKKGSPVHRIQKNEMRKTVSWVDPLGCDFKSERQQKVQDQRQSILRSIHKPSQEDKKLQLDKFRRELRWMSNPDDTMGIGIQR